MNTTGTVWSLTINNPSVADREVIALPPDWIAFIKGQDEIAPTTGTLHFQGMIKTKYTVSFKKIKLLFPTAHIEKAKNVSALTQYVEKTETAVPGTATESAGGESKKFIAPSSYLRLMADYLIELLGDSALTVHSLEGTEYMINVDTLSRRWHDTPPGFPSPVHELVYDRLASIMVQEGYHIELYAIDKKFRVAWATYGKDILRSAGFLDKRCPYTGFVIVSE